VVNNSIGVPLYYGLVRNLNLELWNDLINFNGLDFRIAFDTDILLDFSQNVTQDFTLSGIFQKVCDLVKYNNIFGDNIEIEIVIPEDSSDTTIIADYTGQFFKINAYNFLRTYLQYYNYYIKSELDLANNKIIFTFVKTFEANSRSFLIQLVLIV
jgi:hypothetical protein